MSEEIKLNPGERIDDLQRDGYRLLQNENLFCFGMDAVLLSAFARVKDGEKALDLCAGNGVIPILLKAKTEGKSFTGLEINEDSADLARRSIALNGLEESVSMVCGDLKEADRIFPAASFDVVTCNPPYMTGGHGLVNPDSAVAIARHEVLCTLDDICHQAARMLRPGGRFYMVHRPFRLAEIIRSLSEQKLEPKRIRFVHPYVDKEPNMVLIEAARGGKPRVTVEKPLIIYQDHAQHGLYTDEVKALYDASGVL